MPRPGWTERQTLLGSKMWRSGALVDDIAKAIGKEAQAIYGYARDNRDLFPKRTRGARKKVIDTTELPPLTPEPVENMRPITNRTIRAVKQSIMINERLMRNAQKMGQPRAAEEYRRAAEINYQELKLIKDKFSRK